MIGHALILCGAIAAIGAAAPKVPDFVIVVTGDELLDGLYPDGHTAFLARTLRPLGFRCVRSMVVDDSRADIEQALAEASAKAPLVIVTGGLGPTENDVTREAISEFAQDPLVIQPDVLAAMERRFKQPGEPLRPNLRRQCLVPSRGTYLKNPSGSAVGLVFELPAGLIVALPGPPRELQPMVLQELIPYLSRRYGTRPPARSFSLRFVGLGQSQISHVLDERIHMSPQVLVSSQFEGMRVDYTFFVRDDTPQAQAMLDTLKRQILAELGDNVYADDATSLEELVGRLLHSRGATLAVAEAATGGSLAAALTAAPAAAAVLAGAYAAPSEEKLRALVAVPGPPWKTAETAARRAALLAEATARAAGADWAIAIGDPQQHGTAHSVEVALRPPDGRIETRSFTLRGAGDLARAFLITQLLDTLRRKLR